MTSTSETLAGMFKENTGSSFLDSGGDPKFDSNGNYIGSVNGYGRNHERNQLRTFKNEKDVALKFEMWRGEVEINLVLNTYHWLNERCELATELDELFHGRFREECDQDDKPWLQLMEEFPIWLAEQDEDRWGNPAGIYGEGEPFTVNTYNHENLLDQTLQFHYFSNKEGEFIALQVHGGADVRGGYTTPRIFEVGQFSELDIFDYQRATIRCSGKDHHPTALKLKEFQESQLSLDGIETHEVDFEGSDDHYWTTDDGYHWYHQGSCGFGAETQLEKYETRDLDDEDEEDVWEEGILCVKDGKGYCPYCGALLMGIPY